MSDIKIEASTAEPTPVSTSTPVDQTTTALSATFMDTSSVNDSASKDTTSTPAPRSCTRNVASTKKQQPKSTPTLPVVKAKPAAQPKAAKTPAAHPPFFEMIIQAIRKLNDRAGSSRQAILKFITANFKVTEKQGNQHVKIGLKNAVKAGTLKQVKGVGASGSFKLSEALKTKEKGKDNKKASSSKAVTVAVATKPVKKTSAKKVKKASVVGVAKLSVTVGKKATKEVKKPVKAKKGSVKESVAKPVVARARAAAETAKKVKPAAASKAVAKSKTKTSPTINRKAKTTVQAKKNGRSSRK
jgi:histone H1/5